MFYLLVLWVLSSESVDGGFHSLVWFWEMSQASVTWSPSGLAHQVSLRHWLRKDQPTAPGVPPAAPQVSPNILCCFLSFTVVGQRPLLLACIYLFRELQQERGSGAHPKGNMAGRARKGQQLLCVCPAPWPGCGSVVLDGQRGG